MRKQNNNTLLKEPSNIQLFIFLTTILSLIRWHKVIFEYKKEFINEFNELTEFKLLSQFLGAIPEGQRYPLSNTRRRLLSQCKARGATGTDGLGAASIVTTLGVVLTEKGWQQFYTKRHPCHSERKKNEMKWCYLKWGI